MAENQTKKSFGRSITWSPSRSRFNKFNPSAKSSLPPLQISRPILDTWRSDGGPESASRFDKECSKVADHIFVGGDAVARDRDILRRNGISHVLNCVGGTISEYFKPELTYKTLYLTDSPSEDITSVLYDVFDYFEEVREKSGKVFVHCYQGVSRSISLVIAYLIWRKGQSFDDAFKLVKEARGIANPNVGFACQLLECQKRVNEMPSLSPNAGPRVQRMRPHSLHDPLHLVPKTERVACSRSLDSRGAFLVQCKAVIFVWVGRFCGKLMEKDAKATACQVVRYENVHGEIVIVREGEEPKEFWEAFGEEDVERDGNLVRRVKEYDEDYEVYGRAAAGESHWSVLRRKFISGAVKEWVAGRRPMLSRVNSNSFLVRETDAQGNKVQHLSNDSSTSPGSGERESLLSVVEEVVSPSLEVSSQVIKPLQSLNISSS